MSRVEKEDIQEESFSSDEEFEEEEIDTESSSDVDAKLAEDDVFDIEFFKCYSALKKKDEKIYDKNIKFFNVEDKSSSEDEANDRTSQELDNQCNSNKSHNGPKMTLLDHQLNSMHDDIDEPKIDLNQEVSKSFYQKELDEIKKSIEKVGEDIDSDDEDDDLLIVKNANNGQSSTNASKRIKDMLDKLEEDDEQDIGHLKKIWSDPNKLSEEEKFLKNYIVNKLYLPQNATTSQKKSDDCGFFSKNLDDLSDVDDEDNKDGATKKKHKVDHHSEEKDFDKITRIPRNSTKTIRDLVEKREKKEKRLKSLEKEKKRKKVLKDGDFEDIVGDLPTKFHYRETEPNDYGLSAEELLMATDEELEKWCKLRDTIAYKTPEEELADKERYERRRFDLELKKKIFKSIYGETPDVEQQEKIELDDKAKKKGKKRKRKYSNEAASVDVAQPVMKPAKKSDTIEEKSDNTTNKRKKKHKRGLNHKKFVKTGVAPDRLLAYGLSKNKLKKSKLL